MEFTNAALREMFQTYGERISCLMFDNKNAVFIGHQSSPCKSVDDLDLLTVGGIDLIGVPLYPTNSKDKAAGVMFYVYHITSSLHAVTMVDEDHADYLVDPMVFM